MTRIAALLVGLLLVAGCTSWDEHDGLEEVAGASGVVSSQHCDGTAAADFPDVVGASLQTVGDGRVTVSATLCSAYDTPERYADAWRVLTPSGEVLGVRELLHDHAGEQPFTRSLSDAVTVPDGVTTLVIEGRDKVNGWGGATVEVAVP